MERNKRYAEVVYLLDKLTYDGLPIEELQFVLEAREKVIKAQLNYLGSIQYKTNENSRDKKDCSECETVCDDCIDDEVDAEKFVKTAKDIENIMKKVKEFATLINP